MASATIWTISSITIARCFTCLIVVGRGRWEEELLASTDRLNHVLRSKGINATVDYWGHDVDHDWPWWFKMVEHYLPYLLG